MRNVRVLLAAFLLLFSLAAVSSKSIDSDSNGASSATETKSVEGARLNNLGVAYMNQQSFERALKIAIPITCLVIALFGAPLATSTQRGGTAYGIGLSLAITVTFLMLIQLTKPLGGKNIIWPDVAAWLPNALFAVFGIVLLARVRT